VNSLAHFYFETKRSDHLPSWCKLTGLKYLKGLLTLTYVCIVTGEETAGAKEETTLLAEDEELNTEAPNQEDMLPEEEHSFDTLAKGLASSAISRGQVLKLAGAALVSGTLVALFPGLASAKTIGSKFCKRCRQSGGRCCKGKGCCPTSFETCGQVDGVSCCCPPLVACRQGGGCF
jgi:hypothetical protein